MESSLDTVAVVKASMATIERATMPDALDALRKYASLRKLATPELTKTETDRMGLGTGSLTAYIRDPKKWGENRAGGDSIWTIYHRLYP